ncbi:haloacid dehalogenase type II [Thioalkalivibrio sp. HK1]|uniref:haloacid dehalogenase type II n=1 Tax=Thioalkalivibrio sp. HK1 TaxID=1469245 RepID=UPI00046F09BB|nr:haloacid dehalogenase type II [Thioalkalivibrio sp. HK1]
MNRTIPIRALVFDVFGTVVDWRSGIVRQGKALGERLGIEVDWESFADAWRKMYQPSMERVRSGERQWTPLDVLHRESLCVLLERFGIHGLDDRGIDDFNRAWHRLDPWPDSVAGLLSMRKRHIIATCSNGNIALLVNMAKRANLPWDAILGAEVARAYKPMPQAYLSTCACLGLLPGETVMVAAHNDDLVHAAAHGMRTAFVPRRSEYGPHQTKDIEPEHDFDFIAEDFIELAKKIDQAQPVP